jgi:hypothetical protein
MLVGTKASKTPNLEAIDAKIEGLKKEYGVEEHYLEQKIEDAVK